MFKSLSRFACTITIYRWEHISDYFCFQSESDPFPIWICTPVHPHSNPKPVNIRSDPNRRKYMVKDTVGAKSDPIRSLYINTYESSARTQAPLCPASAFLVGRPMWGIPSQIFSIFNNSVLIFYLKTSNFEEKKLFRSRNAQIWKMIQTDNDQQKMFKFDKY
jgi:hypothetical protein